MKQVERGLHGEKHRRIESAALLKLFKKRYGRDAASVSDLDEFFRSVDSEARVDPYVTLTPDEINECLNTHSSKWSFGAFRLPPKKGGRPDAL